MFPSAKSSRRFSRHSQGPQTGTRPGPHGSPGKARAWTREPSASPPFHEGLTLHCSVAPLGQVPCERGSPRGQASRGAGAAVPCPTARWLRVPAASKKQSRLRLQALPLPALCGSGLWGMRLGSCGGRSHAGQMPWHPGPDQQVHVGAHSYLARLAPWPLLRSPEGKGDRVSDGEGSVVAVGPMLGGTTTVGVIRKVLWRLLERCGGGNSRWGDVEGAVAAGTEWVELGGDTAGTSGGGKCW